MADQPSIQVAQPAESARSAHPNQADAREEAVNPRETVPARRNDGCCQWEECFSTSNSAAGFPNDA